MKLLSEKQKIWLVKRPLNKGDIVHLPQWGVRCGPLPIESAMVFIRNNPFTKSLNSSLVVILGEDSGFSKVRWHSGKTMTFFTPKSELEKRPIVEMVLNATFCLIPFVLINVFRSIKDNYASE